MFKATPSYHDFQAPPCPPPELFRLPRRASRTRPHRLLFSQTPRRRHFALWRNCGNGGSFPGRPRLSRLPEADATKLNSVCSAGSLPCLCEMWHLPLREASRGVRALRLGLKFQQLQRVSQPSSNPLPEKSPDFSPRAFPSYEGLQEVLAGLAWLVVQL